MVISALEHYDAASLIGVLMTGMGNDGAAAMTRLHAQGGRTIAEAEVHRRSLGHAGGTRETGRGGVRASGRRDRRGGRRIGWHLCRSLSVTLRPSDRARRRMMGWRRILLRLAVRTRGAVERGPRARRSRRRRRGLGDGVAQRANSARARSHHDGARAPRRRGECAGAVAVFAIAGCGQRAAAIEALQAMPAAILPFMDALLGDGDSDVRILATELARNLPAATPPAFCAHVSPRDASECLRGGDRSPGGGRDARRASGA